MKKLILLFFLIVQFNFLLIGQAGVGGGLSTMDAVGIDFPRRFGGNIFFEVPRNEVNSFYLRTVIMVPSVTSGNATAEIIDFNNLPPGAPSVITIDAENRSSYISLDGGTRVYLYNTYDAGLALFGSITLKGIYSKYKRRFSDFNTDLYAVTEGAFDDEFGLFLGVSGNLGIKYQLPTSGDILFDIGIDLLRSLTQENIMGNVLSPVALCINLSYRFNYY